MRKNFNEILAEYGEKNFLLLDKEEFLDTCRFSSYKSSGRGGQRKNKKETAVRLLHLETNIFVESSKSRYQSLNRDDALYKLRIKLAYLCELKLVSSLVLTPYPLSKKNWEFPFLLQRQFFFLRKNNYLLSETALELDMSKNALLKNFSRDKGVWNFFNQQRTLHSLPTIKSLMKK